MRRSVSISMCSLVLAPGLLAACGIPSPANSTGTTTGETAAEEAGMSEGSGDGNGLEEEGAVDPMACEAETAALAPFVTRTDGGCSVVVRVDHETLALLGYQSTCAALQSETLDEAGARALTDCCASAGTAFEPPQAPGLWVFHVPPADDEPGRAAIVSSNVGALVFEAGIGSGEEEGEVVVPEAWVEPEGLGQACGAVPMPELGSYDLVEGGAVAEESLREVWNVVGSSALPFAMSVVGEPRQASVVRYARSVSTDGEFDASTAEYLVILEGGIEPDPT